MNEKYGLRLGHYPAVVDSYDKNKRRVKITIEGLGRGLEAELLYPLGDKARSGKDGTEIRIEKGDKVWIEFIGGDQRYPLVVGYRHGETGNDVDWRRWEHANMQWLVDKVAELLAGGDVLIKSETKITVEAPTVHVKGETTTVDSDTTTINAKTATVKADSVTINAQSTSVTGSLSVQGPFSARSGAAITGNSSVTGVLNVSVACNAPNIK